MYGKLKNQFGRRNLTTFQKSELALELEGIFREKAKENQRGGQGGVLLPQNSAKAKVETRTEVANVAGVSHDTISKVKAIKAHGSDELIEAVRQGDVSISAGAACNFAVLSTPYK